MPDNIRMAGMAETGKFKAGAVDTDQPWFVLGAASKYEILMSRDPAISHFYAFEADKSRGLVFAVPDGAVDIVFDCDSFFPQARVCGTTLEARRIELQHQHRYFGVRFALGVIPGFLDVVARDLVNQEINLRNLIPDAEAIFDKMIRQPSIFNRASMFMDFFPRKHNRDNTCITRYVMKIICANHGNIKIQEITDATGWNRRTILRNFQNDTGLSPKIFSRIVRCQAAMHEIAHNKNVIFSDLAHKLGFSDQPHLLRDFKKLTNVTPVDYRNKMQGQIYSRKIQYHHPQCINP